MPPKTQQSNGSRMRPRQNAAAHEAAAAVTAAVALAAAAVAAVAAATASDLGFALVPWVAP